MSISVTDESGGGVPPGFRFHPTEEELLHYYLKKKIAHEKIDLDVIPDVDLNKLEPWDIQEKCKIGSTPQNDWYFFSHKDKKYPTGTRTNRATAAGFWKATGRDKVIYCNSRCRIGMRKTLVFYKGRAPHGQKSDWIMHEYRLLDDNLMISTTNNNVVDVNNNVCINAMEELPPVLQEEGWVVCRIFKKKNYHKTLDHPISISSLSGSDTKDDHHHHHHQQQQQELGLEDILLQYMGETDQARFLRPMVDTTATNYNVPAACDRTFTKLPNLESPKSSSSTRQVYYQSINAHNLLIDNDPSITSCNVNQEITGLNDLESLVLASHLNNISKQEQPTASCCWFNNGEAVGFRCPPPDQDLGRLQHLH